jgi:hypothetical protein
MFLFLRLTHPNQQLIRNYFTRCSLLVEVPSNKLRLFQSTNSSIHPLAKIVKSFMASEFDNEKEWVYTMEYGTMYNMRSQNRGQVFFPKNASRMRVPAQKNKTASKVARLER